MNADQDDAAPRSWIWTAAQLQSHCPSAADGLSPLEVRRLRRAGCNHIADTVRAVLDAPGRGAAGEGAPAASPAPPGPAAAAAAATAAALEQRARAPAATAMVLFNRFFARHSFARHDRRRVAAACAFMGFKVDEAHQKVRSVAAAAWDALHQGRAPRPDAQSAAFAALRAGVLEAERCMLHTLEFDVAVELPFALMGQRVREWREGNHLRALDFARGRGLRDAPAEVAAAMAMANRLAAYALGSDLCLLFRAQTIAAGSLLMAFQTVTAARGMACPVTMALVGRAAGGDLHVVKDFCTRISSYLAEDALADADVWRHAQALGGAIAADSGVDARDRTGAGAGAGAEAAGAGAFMAAAAQAYAAAAQSGFSDLHGADLDDEDGEGDRSARDDGARPLQPSHSATPADSIERQDDVDDEEIDLPLPRDLR